MTAPETPPAVAEFLAARAAAAAALVSVRGSGERIPATAVFFRAQRHAAVVSSSLLVKGHPAEALTYAHAAELLEARGTRAWREHVTRMGRAA